MSFLSELAFASALVYSKRGSSAEAEKSRELRDRLRRGDPVLIECAAQRLATWFDAQVLDQFFGTDVILVPVPGSAAMPKKRPRAGAATGGL